MFLFFFFFQAEDGIRDGTVTGVQTCAPDLPPERQSLTASRTWSSIACSPSLIRLAWKPMNPPSLAASAAAWALAVSQAPYARSEERRVGKECRSRWPPDHEKRNKKTTQSQ